MVIYTWICFFLGSLLVCFRHALKTGWMLLLLAYVLAFISGLITLTGITWLLLTAGILYATTTRLEGKLQVAGHIAFIAACILLFLHKLPGFHNLPVFEKVKFTPNAAPFTMNFNLDKPFIGFILFTCLGSIWYAKKSGAKRLFKAIIMPLLGITAICLGTALCLHFIRWEPKLPPKYWIWLLNNLLLVVVAEEAFFRGYLQGILGQQLFKGKSPILPLVTTALLFGLVHTTGGLALMLLAFIAGIGYGIAYYKGGILAALLTHFCFNLLHFFLFTYPMLA